MNRMRTVLDTNCLVSALLFANGRLSKLRTAWQGGRFVPVLCRETASELIRVLAYPKFRLEPDEANALLAELLPYAETFALAGSITAIEGLPDAADAIFVHLARQAETDWLVSGDSHLLGLKNTAPNMRIISPADFLKKLDLNA